MTKTCSIEKIAAELTRRFREANSNTISIKMKCDGKELSLTLCSDSGKTIPAENESILDFDFILVNGGGIAHTLGGEPKRVCTQLREYANRAAEYADSVRRLTEYCESHKDDPTPLGESDAYGFYSDWHKDLFGHRPMGWTVNYLGW